MYSQLNWLQKGFQLNIIKKINLLSPNIHVQILHTDLRKYP